MIGLAAAAGLGWLSSRSPLDAVLLVAGVGIFSVVCWCAVRRPHYLALLLIAALPWQGALRFPTDQITIVKGLGLLLVGTLLVQVLVARRAILGASKFGLVAVLAVSVTVSALVNGLEHAAGLETIRYWSFVVFTFVIVQFIDDRHRLIQAVQVLVLSATFGAIWAVLQFVTGDSQRASGPISDPNDFAFLLAVVLPLAIALVSVRRHRRWFWMAASAALLGACLAALSRGAVVALVALAIWALATKQVRVRTVLLPAALASLLVAVALLTSSASVQGNLQVRNNGASKSVEQRASYWRAAMNMWSEKPIFGFGPDSFAAHGYDFVRNPARTDHALDINSTYLSFLAENGGLPLLLFLGLLGQIWVRLRRFSGSARGGDVEGAVVARALRGATLVATVGGIFFSAQLSSPYWLLLALCIALTSHRTTSDALEAPLPAEDAVPLPTAIPPSPRPATRRASERPSMMTKRLKVTHIITGLQVGGAETMLLKLLANADTDRYDLSVISLTSEGVIGPRISDLGVPVHAAELPTGRLTLNGMRRLVRLLRGLEPQVIQTWMYHADLVGGSAALLAGRPPVIWGIRQNLDPTESKRHTLLTARACARASSRIPTRIVSCSQVLADEHVAMGYDGDRMMVIPNGFELTRFRPSSESRLSTREGLGADEDDVVVGITGRFDPQKDYRTFIEAAKLVAPHAPRVRFVLCGRDVDGDNADLQSWIARAGVGDKCTLLGLRGDMPRVLNAFDVAVSSSSFGEGFSNALGEALACGVPCVATDVGDARLVVGRAGVVVQPRKPAALAAGILELASMAPGERQALGAAGRRHIEDNFEIGAVTRRFERLYDDLTRP